jgi:carboxyl-terminal processing protease
MNNSFKNPFVATVKKIRQNTIPLSLLIAFTTSSFVAAPVNSEVKKVLENSPKTVVDEVWQIVNNEFVDQGFNHTDWLKTREELLSRNYGTREEAYKAIRDSLKRLGDKYTRFLPPEEFESLTSQTSGELSGVGVKIEIDQNTGILTVVDALPNSPAEAAGLKTGDQITKIDDQSTALMSLDQASEAMRGKVGTDLVLEISRPQDKTFAITLTRAQIELPSLSYSVKEEDGLRLGYIKLDEFSAHASEQMEKAISKMTGQNVSAFVLDLRGNPGGLLYASVDIARMWMENGLIVRTVDRRGGDRKFSANNTAITNLPLVVLVDENSASASEILAGALKDNKRATIVGTTTFGKGTVQSLHSLSDGSGLAVTMSRYYPPSGININKKGITPDITENLSREQRLRLNRNPDLVGTTADPQYSKAVSILKTANLVQPNNIESISINPLWNGK